MQSPAVRQNSLVQRSELGKLLLTGCVVSEQGTLSECVSQCATFNVTNACVSCMMYILSAVFLCYTCYACQVTVCLHSGLDFGQLCWVLPQLPLWHMRSRKRFPEWSWRILVSRYWTVLILLVWSKTLARGSVGIVRLQSWSKHPRLQTTLLSTYAVELRLIGILSTS